MFHSQFSSPAHSFHDEEVERLEALLAGKKVPDGVTLHKYSPAIAKLLNPTQPDVAAAALFYQISLRQKNPCPRPWGISRMYALRSLHHLSQDCLYLSKPGVAKAIQRMRSKFQNGFFISRDFVKLSYSISEDLLKLQKEDPLICFNPADAALHGNIRSAVLLRHMRCVMRDSQDWTLDNQGNRYVRMSPSKLSLKFGYSEDTISRCMKELRQKDVVFPHPEQPSWYTFSSPKLDAGHSFLARMTHL